MPRGSDTLLFCKFDTPLLAAGSLILGHDHREVRVMKYCFSIEPGQIDKEYRMLVETTGYRKYTAAFIGPYTYCWNTCIDNGLEFSAPDGRLYYDLQIGSFNSIGNNLCLCFGKNHNIKRVSSGALDLFFKMNQIDIDGSKSSFDQKGDIIIQNDVWMGENVTIMPNVIVKNGAVIARNSHVVSDVPPYAVVGGNPAHVIGYRYEKEQIQKLQQIQWWYWDTDKMIENTDHFTEDIDGFCNRFYEEARDEYETYVFNRKRVKDTYFVFVDYYEEYRAFPYVLTDFLDIYSKNTEKRLILFVRDDHRDEVLDDGFLGELLTIVDDIAGSSQIVCSVEVRRGSFLDAKKAFLECSHFITTRTYDTVYFTCLADLLGIEIISGVDSNIQFVKRHNIHLLKH